MIYRRDGDWVLMDIEALWVDSAERPISTIRAKCEPIACDVATHRLLYDAGDASERLSRIARRAPHRRGRQRGLTSQAI